MLDENKQSSKNNQFSINIENITLQVCAHKYIIHAHKAAYTVELRHWIPWTCIGQKQQQSRRRHHHQPPPHFPAQQQLIANGNSRFRYVSNWISSICFYWMSAAHPHSLSILSAQSFSRWFYLRCVCAFNRVWPVCLRFLFVCFWSYVRITWSDVLVFFCIFFFCFGFYFLKKLAKCGCYFFAVDVSRTSVYRDKHGMNAIQTQTHSVQWIHLMVHIKWFRWFVVFFSICVIFPAFGLD